MISTVLAWRRRLERGLAMALLVAVFALVFVATATRYLGSPVIWAIEATQAMFIWLCVIAADITLQSAGHFSVPMLADLLPPRARRWLDIAGGLAVLGLLAFLAWHGAGFARMSSGRPLPMLGISEGVATAALPVGFALMAVTVVEQVVARWTRAAPSVPAASRDVM